MSEPAEAPPRPPTDEQYADAYAAGYGEGLREAFREMLSLTGRGHTPQELRFVMEGRLARLREDVEVKRRSLLSPPRRTSWGTKPHAPLAPEPGSPVVSPANLAALLLEPGQSYLFLESRPRASLDFVADHQDRFPRLLAVGRRAPVHPRIPAERWTIVPVGGPEAESDGRQTLDLPRAAGRLREATEAEGGALIFLDAIELLVTEFGVDLTMRFASFVIGQVQRTASVLVVSEEPHGLAPTEQSRFQRLFNIVP